ncbi:unnamed protein product [Pleuronectes platessa]|uniref:Uncharacterized protein n=1 Tax=Pleuronectes platessa TaxID=8262 RepID=A0A9N7V9R7_PLEPL|nr:unnamed protein product [Pleuronectes platessa]
MEESTLVSTVKQRGEDTGREPPPGELAERGVGSSAEEIDFGVYCPAICHTKPFALDKATGHLDPLKLTVNINAALRGKKINRNNTSPAPTGVPQQQCSWVREARSVSTAGVKTARRHEFEIHNKPLRAFLNKPPEPPLLSRGLRASPSARRSPGVRGKEDEDGTGSVFREEEEEEEEEEDALSQWEISRVGSDYLEIQSVAVLKLFPPPPPLPPPASPPPRLRKSDGTHQIHDIMIKLWGDTDKALENLDGVEATPAQRGSSLVTITASPENCTVCKVLHPSVPSASPLPGSDQRRGKSALTERGGPDPTPGQENRGRRRGVNSISARDRKIKQLGLSARDGQPQWKSITGVTASISHCLPAAIKSEVQGEDGERLRTAVHSSGLAEGEAGRTLDGRFITHSSCWPDESSPRDKVRVHIIIIIIIIVNYRAAEPPEMGHPVSIPTFRISDDPERIRGFTVHKAFVAAQPANTMETGDELPSHRDI